MCPVLNNKLIENKEQKIFVKDGVHQESPAGVCAA